MCAKSLNHRPARVDERRSENERRRLELPEAASDSRRRLGGLRLPLRKSLDAFWTEATRKRQNALPASAAREFAIPPAVEAAACVRTFWNVDDSLAHERTVARAWSV